MSKYTRIYIHVNQILVVATDGVLLIFYFISICFTTCLIGLWIKNINNKIKNHE